MSRVLRGIFTEEDDLMQATRTCREEGLEIVDAYTPYAVHGLDRAMGLKPSRIAWVCFILGALGCCLKLWFQVWTSIYSWPVNIGGKPLNSLPAFVPVTFEVAVLFAGLGIIFTLFIRSRLFPWSRRKPVHPRITDDRFALDIRQSDPNLDPGLGSRLLQDCGAVEILENVDGDAA
jgi:hypothetical protein